MVLSLFKKKTPETKEKPGARYVELQVKEIISETSDAVTIVFENPGNQVKYKPGQYITLIFNIDGEEIRRSYSLCSSPYTETVLSVTVKRIDHGKISNYIHELIRPGDKIKAMEPMGVFTTTINPEDKRQLILFAGGSGITPLISIAKSVLKMESQSRVLLVYQNRNEQAIIKKNELEYLAGSYGDRFMVHHILSKPSAGWQGLSGRISPEMIRQLTGNLVTSKDFTNEYFLCGPQGMMEIVEKELKNLGVSNNLVRKESFVSASPKEANTENSMPPGSGKKARIVTIILHGTEYKIKVEPNGYILETALDADVNMPFSCQSGLCTACRGKLLSGKVYMNEPDGLSEQEIADGYVLSCVGQPLTDDVVIEIG